MENQYDDTLGIASASTIFVIASIKIEEGACCPNQEPLQPLTAQTPRAGRCPQTTGYQSNNMIMSDTHTHH